MATDLLVCLCSLSCCILGVLGFRHVQPHWLSPSWVHLHAAYDWSTCLLCFRCHLHTGIPDKVGCFIQHTNQSLVDPKDLFTTSFILLPDNLSKSSPQKTGHVPVWLKLPYLAPLSSESFLTAFPDPGPWLHAVTFTSSRKIYHYQCYDMP